MIGQRIQSRLSIPWSAFLFLAIGIAMIVGGLAIGQHPLSISGVLPIVIGLTGLLMAWERHFSAEFTEETIEIEDPPASIPYDSLQDVRVGDGLPHDPWTYRKNSVPIHVQHGGGVIHIPSRLDVPSHEVYRFLADQIPANGDRAVNPALAEYLERQEGYFGAEHIWTYRAVKRGSPRGRNRFLRAFCIGLMLTGAIWIAIGASGITESVWAGCGIACFFLGFCFFLATLAETHTATRLIKGWKNASLVISPQGMAMVQGDIQGEVRWPELLEVRYKPKPSAFRMHYAQGLNGILLRVKGADIIIADIYDRPLYLIHERIRASSGQTTPQAVDL